MTLAHNLGFPRIGATRELKFALEKYWRGDIDQAALEQQAADLRRQHWQLQVDAGLDLLPVNDFSFYDHILDHSALLGCVPPRFGQDGDEINLDTYFRMARGHAPHGKPAAACEMTKWFDTNYHYIVPEFYPQQNFKISSSKLFDEVSEAQKLGYTVKPVIPGPLTWLWLGKVKQGNFDKLDCIENLIPVYGEILNRLAEQGVEWVQIDEPILALDLPREWKQALEKTYNLLQSAPVKLLLATYFGALEDNLQYAVSLPVAGLHIDAVRAPEELTTIIDQLPAYKTLSVGIIDGRNIWRADLQQALSALEMAQTRLGDRFWVAPSCSLLHLPVDLQQEDALDPEIISWLAFALQKTEEVVLLKKALTHGRQAIAAELENSETSKLARQQSTRIHQESVKKRLDSVTKAMAHRKSSYLQRSLLQRKLLNLPLFPTTTIGSFPQTAEIRKIRRDFKQNLIGEEKYIEFMQNEIQSVIKKQEILGLDVLVHGEPERNDMVEYFGELLNGFAFTRFGWVQSYGSRCVKPPIIYGDVTRPEAMTVSWSRYAQSCTDKPMKGMLTGPVTILNWSFVRDDQARSKTCTQIALALRDEVTDLEQAGIKIIQIDEAALREGLPLRKSAWKNYLDWAVKSFRLTACGVKDETQIHTHMCYSEFNDIIESIANMDADVITIETSRSDMELLDVFEHFNYPNEIGPGVYDIHSPNIPDVEQIIKLMQKAAERIPAERLWVNPDCGLKTRGWPEVETALKNMVTAAKALRHQSLVQCLILNGDLDETREVSC